MPKKLQIVQYQKGRRKFEIITKPGAVIKYKEGKLGFNNVCSTYTIYKNARKLENATEADLEAVFKTTLEEKICELILKMGTLQLTTKEREAKVQQKTKEILQYIQSNWEDPNSKLPHQMVALENAFKAAKYKVDVDGDAVKQAEYVVGKMKKSLRFAKISQISGTLTIAIKYMVVVEGLIRRFATVTNTAYSGSVAVYEFECSRGNLEKIQAALFKPTNGNYQLELPEMDKAPTEEVTGKVRKQKKEKKAKKKKKK